MVFAMIHCTEKKDSYFFLMVMFLSLFSKSYPSTYAPFSRPLLAGSDGTIISCYSHESSSFGNTFLQK